ncbi:TetR/AcrR family transcriptional regulator [Ornithinimicrobium pratense]|uniref:TetR/AcrR family transcriptional regulator n=1 Tax=Ornithinimicrobium pratense TaxID=2593973 RepID=A0A5J6V3B8_9MICO|nr:TetR family transcriptional regulator [Ornithinimicrobium pratense]QFG67443.1 TetR/AcrR family transcriptional regulator [Ornithinimicrobium pratense]
MTTKAERTRELLVETALRLFRERGYEATTMRLIAHEARMSPGSAYYYFEGKDALVHELYVRIQQEHRQRALPLLQDGAGLADNLRTVLHTGLDTMAPYHAFGSTMLHVALSRSSSVSPFSEESAAARAAATSLMREVLTVSRGPRGTSTHPRLAELLWLGYLGVTLHWVTDTSPDQRRTRVLVDGVAPIIARTVTLSRLPVGRRLAGDVFRLMDRLASPTADRSDP